MRKSVGTPLIAAALGLCTACVVHAAPTLLDYNSIPAFSSVNPYDQNGFRTSGELFAVGGGQVTPKFAGGQITIASLVAGTPFALTSIDFRLFQSNSSFNFTVFGDLVGGGTASQLISGLTTSLQTYTFGSAFADVVSVRFTQGPSFAGSDDIIFDNVRLGDAVAVPEPATMALVMLALAGVAATRRRQ